MSFEEITEGRSARISAVLDGAGANTDRDRIISFYNSASYRKYHGGKGSTAHRTWRFTDSEGTVLFTLTDLGNRNLIGIAIDGKETLYRAM